MGGGCTVVLPYRPSTDVSGVSGASGLDPSPPADRAGGGRSFSLSVCDSGTPSSVDPVTTAVPFPHWIKVPGKSLEERSGLQTASVCCFFPRLFSQARPPHPRPTSTDHWIASRRDVQSRRTGATGSLAGLVLGSRFSCRERLWTVEHTTERSRRSYKVGVTLDVHQDRRGLRPGSKRGVVEGGDRRCYGEESPNFLLSSRCLGLGSSTNGREELIGSLIPKFTETGSRVIHCLARPLVRGKPCPYCFLLDDFCTFLLSLRA